METRVAPAPAHDWDDPDWYPAHEEDDVPEIVVHHDAAGYLEGILAAHVPDGWVTGNICCYCIPGNTQRYVAPDIFLVDGPRPSPPPSSFLCWQHPEMRLAVGIG